MQSQVPSQAEFGLFRAAIAQIRDPNTSIPVWTQQQINDAVGQQVNGRTWNTIEIDLNDFMKVAPKA